MSRILLAGESWITTSIHTKGFDSFTTSTYAEGADAFIAVLRDAGHRVTYLPNHLAADRFPSTAAELAAYDLVVLSDIGANTLLLPPGTFIGGQPRPNRLAELASWVRAGGALLMVGGYLSFQGIEGKANYANTSLAGVLPVELEAGDDREETPEGIHPGVLDMTHPMVAGLPATWPAVLGYQRVRPKQGAEVIASVGSHPLLVVGAAGAGLSAAFTSDMGPHWLPDSFVNWDGYARLWRQCVAFLCANTGSDAPASTGPESAMASHDSREAVAEP
ncbi:MAG: glutamine amidotransferase [Streptosporangiaceae bacterium]